MRFTSTLLLALGAATTMAAPTADTGVESVDAAELVDATGALLAATTYTCNTKDVNDPKKPVGVKLSVSGDTASKEANAGGFKEGKSGDPHRYHNGENLKWNDKQCDRKGAALWEYPLYWTNSKQKTWKKDTSTSQQEKTPIRAVYVKDHGKAHLCGVMIHPEVKKDGDGYASATQTFAKCSS